MMVTLIALVCLGAGQACDMPSIEVDAFLAGLSKREPEFGKRVAEVAARSVGTAYVGDPLGEGPDGKYDKDPQMDLAHVDCVTFIEQTIALAASASRQTAFDNLQKIRYRGGKVGFEFRNHFMEADWVPNNAFCVDVSKELGVPVESVTRTISRKNFFDMKKCPELGAGIPDEPMTLSYVPFAQVSEAVKKIPSPSLVLFIGKVDWLFATHCALFVRDANGKEVVYHASSTAKKVVESTLPEMFEGTTRYLGFTAYKITPPVFSSGPSK